MRMHKNLLSIVGIALAAWMVAPAGADKPIPPHPKKIVYPSLDYTIPPAAEFRTQLANGMVVYIAEDRMLPWFDLTVTIRTGGAFDPPGKAGLATLAGELLRDGGTKNLTPEEFDERADFLAASLFSRIGDTRGNAGVSLLAKDIDEGLELLIDMLRRPRFDEERLRLAKDRRLQNVKRRNDSTGSIEGIEWGFLMDGEDHFSNRYPSSESISAVTREDLQAFHRRFVHPGNMIIAVAGDFDRARMIEKLQQVFGDWPAGETAPRAFPEPRHDPQAGVYMIHKEEVNQGRVSIGHKSIMRGSPDEYALTMMNAILGAGSFRSRLMSKVRSNEGLAYSVGSQLGQGVYYPGDFRCYFQSKSNSCAYAVQLVIREIELLQKEKVSQEELDDAIALYVESLPQRFQSKMALLGTYVGDEYTGRDPSYWQSYVANIKKVTVADVMRVAQKYLHPDHLTILAVGDVDAILSGGHDKAPELRFDRFGKVTKLPLRDPDTLKR